ncbi:SMP-30/gluconolactonase/LRE family protein [Falsigemmobacter faecalis]|uniref:Strictosidine synthase n=1 Tax=Falsigemmobacter faecalis TaxID=2488730 RepID=A0A3P3D5Y8_9RHOB|nr:hypothetical protein [Falsigemmobacter faecalis]RRH69775.1 hypothetical protein EG244_18055 [Falsigemmobacter faecalis]
MIAAIRCSLDSFFGRGEAAVTLPPLDGALRANRRLDDEGLRRPLPGVTALAVAEGGLYAAAERSLHRLHPDHSWQKVAEFEAEIAALSQAPSGGMVLALSDGQILTYGLAGTGVPRRSALRGITDLAVTEDGTLWITCGSDRHGAEDWQRDLMLRGAGGSLWRLAAAEAQPQQIAGGLAWAGGVMACREGVILSESWRHRLLRLSPGGAREVVLGDLPAYPGRLSATGDGAWLSMFAPRSQLVEFVLREPAYCHRMLTEVARDYWIAPRMRSGQSFYEALQNGAVKQLGLLKPWAPSMSAGIVLRLDAGAQPLFSLQSRADGRSHGVTHAVEADGFLHVAAAGDEVVITLSGDAVKGDAA